MSTSYDTAFKDIPEGMAAMAEMCSSGDTKYVWDPNVPDEVEAAREHFNMMRKKGFMVFKLKAWIKTERVNQFDPGAKRYAFVPSEEMKAKGKLPKGRKGRKEHAEGEGPKAQVALEFDPEATRYVAVPAMSGG